MYTYTSCWPGIVDRELSLLLPLTVPQERWHLLGADDNLEWCVLFYVRTFGSCGRSPVPLGGDLLLRLVLRVKLACHIADVRISNPNLCFL